MGHEDHKTSMKVVSDKEKLDACTAAHIPHFLQGDGSASNNVFTTDHITQCFASLDEAIDTDRMVGHLVVDVCIESRWC